MKWRSSTGVFQNVALNDDPFPVFFLTVTSIHLTTSLVFPLVSCIQPELTQQWLIYGRTLLSVSLTPHKSLVSLL